MTSIIMTSNANNTYVINDTDDIILGFSDDDFECDLEHKGLPNQDSPNQDEYLFVWSLLSNVSKGDSFMNCHQI